MSWVILVVSGVLEAVWATALGKSEGFSRLWPTVVFGVALGPCTFAYMAPMLGVTFRLASTNLPYGILLLVLYGVCDGVSVVVRSTIMQLSTPDEMRGRVSSVNSIFISSSNELGAFYAGSMARLLGLVPAVVLGGFATIGVAAITARKAPRLRRLDLRELQ